MDRKTRIFFAAYLAAGLLCLLAVLVSKLPGIASRTLRPDVGEYGELYNMCKVSRFRIPRSKPDLPVDNLPPEHGIGDASVVFVGDSFMGKDYGWDLGMMFEKKTGIPCMAKESKGVVHSPVEVLDPLGCRMGGRLKYVVFECAERVLVLHPTLRSRVNAQGTTSRTPGGKAGKNGVLAEQADSALKHYMIDPLPLEYLVTENPLGHSLMALRNTFRFEAFGEMSEMVPVYSVHPPMLHYKQEVQSNRKPKTDREVAELADYVRRASDELREKYGVRLIFMPVPNKYTLYGYDYGRYSYNTSGERYDEFIPRLYRELDNRGVDYVDLYTPFRESRVPVYDPAHAHWNFTGKHIAVEALEGKCKKLEAE